MGTRSFGRPVTVRTRLALIFSALVFLFGAGTLLVTYVLVAHVLPHRPPPAVDQFLHAPHTGSTPPSADQLRAMIGPAFQQQQGLMLEHLLIGSAIALVLLAIVVAILSWRIADRALAPLRTITETARRLSQDNLGDRIGLSGPPGELKELADTFDGMLARLDKAFQDQRQFVANASHELRTPLAISRSLVEVALADPAPTLASWRSTAESLLANGARMEGLITSLLVLARGEQGSGSLADTELDALAEDAFEGLSSPVRRLRHKLRAAPVRGDPMLLLQTTRNLLENAVRYNRTNGWISIATGTRADESWIRVSNSGPHIPAERVQELLLPFHRLAAQRTDSQHGAGLGLAIVDAVTRVHGGHLSIRARSAGGLTVTIFLPRRAASTDRPSGGAHS